MSTSETNQLLSNRLLYALFCLSRDNRATDAAALGHAVGVGPLEAARGLVSLERAGLVDATRARLTMLGLAKATQMSRSDLGGQSLDFTAVTPKKQVQRLPWAAESDRSPRAAGTDHGGDSASEDQTSDRLDARMDLSANQWLL